MRQRSQIEKGLVQIMEETEKELEVEATLDNLATVLRFVEAEAEKAGCPKKETKQLAVAIEELYVNVASYAYTPATGTCSVKLQTGVENDTGICIVKLQTGVESDTGGWIRILLKDYGKKFNPLLQEPPDITLSADDRPVGGLGILMVKELVDRLEYMHENGENILSVEKHWQ